MRKKMYLAIEGNLYYISIKKYNEIVLKYSSDKNGGEVDNTTDEWWEFLHELCRNAKLIGEVKMYNY